MYYLNYTIIMHVQCMDLLAYIYIPFYILLIYFNKLTALGKVVCLHVSQCIVMLSNVHL